MRVRVRGDCLRVTLFSRMDKMLKIKNAKMCRQIYFGGRSCTWAARPRKVYVWGTMRCIKRGSLNC